MAVSFLAHEVSDLCLAKPALRSLSVTATVADALSALKNSDETTISVWDCNHSSRSAGNGADQCRCVGKVCMVDVICFLCQDRNLSSPSDALKAPVSDLLPKIPGLVVHLESCSRLVPFIYFFLKSLPGSLLNFIFYWILFLGFAWFSVSLILQTSYCVHGRLLDGLVCSFSLC